MPKDVAIILTNGSLNSAVVAAVAAQKYRLVLVYAETGVDPAVRQRGAYDLQAAHFKPFREHTISLPYLQTFVSNANHSVNDPRVPVAIVPQLLDLLPLIAAAGRFAAHYEAVNVQLGLRVGVSSEDLATATEYLQIWSELFQLPCKHPDLQIEAPLMELDPWQVVDLGFQVGAPFERTWSCSEKDVDPCWTCRGCRTREAAFQQSGKTDPLRAAVKKN